MSFFLILPNYLVWHYSKGLIDFKNLWANFIVFFYEFFSIPTLIFTLFSPWHRMQDSYSGQLTFENTVGTFIVNTLMRLVGALVRSIFIVLGIFSIIFTVFFGALVFCAWVVLPFILLYTLTEGINLLLL